MSLSPSESLRRTYRMASLELEAKSLRTGPDWKSVQKINADHQRKTEMAERAYRAEYKTRVETALKKRIDIAASVRREHNMVGNDRFDKSALVRQAHRDVRQGHHNDLAKIDNTKAEGLDQLITQAKSRDQNVGQAKDGFVRAVGRDAPAETRTQAQIHQPPRTRARQR